MFVTSVKSSRKIIHKPGCCHLHNVHKINLAQYETLKEALSAGCHACADCLKTEKLFDDDYREIKAFAEENKMTWDISEEGITIRTKRSGWKIMAGTNEKYAMYHANDNGISQKGDAMPGYHFQKAHYNTVIEYFKYVVDHDAYRKMNPVKPTKRKGTAGYRDQMNRIEKKRKYYKVVNVYKLIDSLACGTHGQMLAFAE